MGYLYFLFTCVYVNQAAHVNLVLHTHTRLTAFFSGTTRVSRYQKGKTNLDFTKARDSEWQRHQLVHVQVCTSLQTDNHTSTPPLSFLQAGCPSCRPTNSVKALMSTWYYETKMVVMMMMMMMMMMMTAVHWLRCSGRCRAYSHRCNTYASARTHCAVIKTIKMLNTQ